MEEPEMSLFERGAERAEDAADLKAKEERREQTFGVCWCTHLRMDHPTPYLCAVCSCGEYEGVAKI